MRVYKVVYVGRSLVSAAAPSAGEVEYRLGKTTTPPQKCGPLAAFKTLADACDFALTDDDVHYDDGHYRVFEAEAQTSLEDKVYCPGRFGWQGEHMREIETLPPGTILCNWIRLLRRVA